MAKIKDLEMRIENDWFEYGKTIGSFSLQMGNPALL